MKNFVISLCIIGLVFVATFVSAECVDQAKLVGTWERFDTEVEALGDDPVAAVKALEAGEKAIEDFEPMFGGTGYYPGDAHTMELSESGDLTFVATMADTLDFENDLEAYVFFTMKGTWAVDCDALTSQAASVEKMEISTAHLTEEQQTEFEGEVAEMQADMDEEKADFEQQALAYYGLIAGKILYFSEPYMLLKTADDEYMIFRKK